MNAHALVPALAAVFFLASCKEPPPTRAQLESRAGTMASVAASFTVQAVRDCRIVGIGDNIDECAKLQGNLLEEKSAAVTARVATKQRDDYFSWCDKSLGAEYCNDLFKRAITIAWRSPE